MNLGQLKNALLRIIGTDGYAAGLSGGDIVGIPVASITDTFGLPADHRITLTSGDPVDNNVSGSTVYLTPYRGNKIALYTGSVWSVLSVAELSIALPGTTDTNYDLFVDYNSGTPQLELVAWTDGTTRATAIVRQDGVYCKTGDLTKRYVGTVRTGGTSGQAENTESERFVWNYYNRIPSLAKYSDQTSHTYSTGAWRYWNNSSSAKVELVIGVNEVAQRVHATGQGEDTLRIGFGVNVNNAHSGSLDQLFRNSNSSNICAGSTDRINTGLASGYSYVSAVEYGDSAPADLDAVLLIVESEG